MRRSRLNLALVLAAMPMAQSAAIDAPLVAVCYRGVPAGTPRVSDIAALRAIGFAAVAWPSVGAEVPESIRRITGVLDVRLVEGCGGAPGPKRIDVSGLAGGVEALAWRAVQDGATTVVFDAREPSGDGTTDGAGALRSWVEPARAMARQFQTNPGLFAQLEAVPITTIDAGGAGVRVSLFRTPRSWLLLATNAGAAGTRFVVRLPRDVPVGLWMGLLDGSGMSMPRLSAGPTWSAEIDAGQVLLYLIDREESR